MCRLAWFLVFAVVAMPSMAEQLVAGSAVTRPGDHFGQIMFSLVLVVVLIFVVAWLLRRFNKFGAVANGNLKVHGVLQVGQRERIILLEVADKQLLIGVTSSKISTLHELENPIDFAQKPSGYQVSNKFYQRLQEAIGQRKPE